MDQNLLDDEFSQWFSTYGVITSQRIFGHYQIELPQKELIPAIKNQKSFYHVLVQVPLKNVLNGIILQQANDYHIYAQKLFIDYLLSGESGKPPEAPGASTREMLEEERNGLLTLGEEYNQKQLDHEALISSTQSEFIKLSRELKENFEKGVNFIQSTINESGSESSKGQIKNSFINALIQCGRELKEDEASRVQFVNAMNEVLKISMTDSLRQELIKQLDDIFSVLLKFQKKINEFLERVNEISTAARIFRKQFYDKVLQVIELINILPEYKINPEQDAENRESLYFDKTIGETSN